MSKNQQKTDKLNWAELQKQYFDALMHFNSANPFTKDNNSFSAGNPFTNINNPFMNNPNVMDQFTSINNPFMSNPNVLEQWWKSLNMNASNRNENINVFEKLVEQGRFYHFIAEQFSNLYEGLSEFKGSDEDINDFINAKFRNLQDLFSKVPENMTWNGFIDPFEKPFQTMKDSVSKDMFNFAGLFGSVQPEMQKMRNQFLSMPGVGHNREMQEKLQRLLNLAAIYQEHENEKQMEMARLTQDALEIMRKKITDMSKAGETFTSMRQVYDLWIESNESVYTDFVYSEKYSELNGKAVNSQMAFMKLSHEVNEDILTAMNMPTTKAMNELERRHYELRKKVKTLESEISKLKVKEKTDKKSKASKSKSVVAETETVIAKVAKKKTTKKKVAKKKIVKKEASSAKRKPAKKKVAKAKTVQKQTTPVSSSKDDSKDNVIELKF